MSSAVSFNFILFYFFTLLSNCTLLISLSEIVFTAVCMLPIPPPMQICSCGPNQDFTVIPGKQTVLVTINGMSCHFLLLFYIRPDEVKRNNGLLLFFCPVLYKYWSNSKHMFVLRSIQPVPALYMLPTLFFQMDSWD